MDISWSAWIYYRKSVDVDYILIERDQFYKSLKCQYYLNVHQLSRQVKISKQSLLLYLDMWMEQVM